ncbi:MAG: LuxR C-terminal-related transcriptional regulator [Thermodesulfobacteriota bacterium]
MQPQLVLLDLSMPGMNGLEALKEIKKQCPKTKVVVLTVHSAEEYVLATLKAGAEGFILKDASATELLLALRNVVSGRPYLSPGIADKVIGGYLDSRKTLEPQSAWETLTDRERQVLKLIAEGRTNKEIADYLYISPKTVEKHRANLMRKLDLHNTLQLQPLPWRKDWWRKTGWQRRGDEKGREPFSLPTH